jgi:hypothetical protein
MNFNLLLSWFTHSSKTKCTKIFWSWTNHNLNKQKRKWEVRSIFKHTIK